MKTVFINCSPKKRFCASAYFLFLQRLFTGGQKVTEKLRTRRIMNAFWRSFPARMPWCSACRSMWTASPPMCSASWRRWRHSVKRKACTCMSTVIANNGFIEGRQNEPLMQVFEHFCARAGLIWGGGVGIGGGVMLNVTRIMFLVNIGLLALNTLLSIAHTGSFFAKEAWISFAENAALLLFFNLGVLYYLIRMGLHIRRGTFSGRKYTRILVPSFLFILFADIFFIVISFFEGGLFRGWLAKKPRRSKRRRGRRRPRTGRSPRPPSGYRSG